MKLKARTLILAVVILLAVSCQVSVFAEDTGSGATQPAAGKLQNGSFETFGDSRFPQTSASKYTQVIPQETDYWKTTAYERKMELLRENTGVYIKGVKITPRDGEIAAELNADEESSLYQVVDTEPSSLYEWGISHAARVKSDTMAIIIGPNQDVAPSKNIGEGVVSGTTITGYKYGRDQMMQMVTWLKSSGAISDYDSAGIAGGGKPIVLYSKKFAEHGGFEDNADNQPFSMTSSRTYTEKWYIWVITDDAITETVGSEKILKWYDYGSNAESGEQTGENFNKNYLYNVPSGQTKTLFAFTSVETKPEAENKVSNPTYGNFLDSVNFKIYRSLSGSTTPNGSAVIGSSDGSSSAEGAETGHEITSGNGVKTYVQDGSKLTIRAEIAAADKDEVSFAGVYCTIQKPDGSGAEKNFIPATDEGWTITEEEGKIVYTRVLDKVESAVDLHFVFVRSPRITYDSNGGKPYDCQQTEKADKADPDNVYSFKPIEQEDGQLKYIDPYTSHAAEGQNDAWKFTGWMLFDSSHYYEELLPAVHKVAYSQNEGNTANNTFTVIKGTDSFKEPVTGENGKTWTPEDGVTPLYSNKAPGLSFVAQWRWKQTFIPRTDNGSGFTESDEGGTVKVVNIVESDPNYEGNNAKGAKAYYAEKGETVTAQAAAKEGYTFAGWYDADGNRASLDSSLSYIETKEGINTYYAHFVKQYTQRYIRQIEEGGVWTDLKDEDATKAELLDHTILHDGIGTTVSATAANNSSYSLMGWYDSEGNPVPDDMLINGGKTIRYAVKGNATYYARFVPSKQVLFKMQYVDYDGSISKPVAATETYGKLSTYAEYGAKGDTVSSKAYPAIGYEFVGWYASHAGTEKITDILDVTDPKVITPEISNEDGVTYYARFRARIDVKYRVEHYFKNWNGATNGNYTRVKYFDYTDGVTGQSVTPPLIDLTAEGYEGYRYEKGRDAQEIKGNGSTVFKIYYTRDVVPLKYEINMPEDESISQDDATGSMADKEGYAGYTVQVGPQEADTEFAVTGYTFNGWNTEADGSGTAYSNGDDYLLIPLETAEGGLEVNPNILYAQWVKRETSASYKVQHYKVDLEGNASLAAEDVLSGEIGTNVTASPKTFEGYTYQENYDEGGRKTVRSGTVTEGGGLVLTLYYTPQADTLTYKAGGAAGDDFVERGFVGEVKTVKNGAELFEREGYTFNGWKTPSGAGYSKGDSYTLTTGDDILIAQWKANTNTRYRVYHYLVSSDGLSASLAKNGEESLTGTTGQTVWAKAKEIPGYKYNAGFDSNGMKTVSSGVVAADGSLVLSLYYIPEPAKLIYEPNGAKADRYTVNGIKGLSTYIEPGTIFSRPGYNFTGWNTKADGSGDVRQPAETYIFEASEYILYAQWEYDPLQSAEDMHFQKVWINAKGELMDYNIGPDNGDRNISFENVKTRILVSNDNGASWTALTEKYDESGKAVPVTDEDMYISAQPKPIFSGMTEDSGKAGWILPVLRESWHLPKYDEDGKELLYRIEEDESSLSGGWKRYDGDVSYTENGAVFTNPVTGRQQEVSFFAAGGENRITKKAFQDNLLVINYDSRKPAALTVNKINGNLSSAETKIPVEGAAFELYEKSDDGDVEIEYKGSSILCRKVGNEKKTVLSENGKSASCTFEEVLARGGEYYLIETKAPAGYRLLAEPVKIYVDTAEDKAVINDSEEKAFTENLNIELANYLNLNMPAAGIKVTGRLFVLLGQIMLLVSLSLVIIGRIRKI